MRYSKLEATIVAKIENLNSSMEERFNYLLSTGMFKFCNCADCYYQDDRNKALVLVKDDSFFFRLMTFRDRESERKEMKLVLIIYKYDPKHKDTHYFSRGIGLEELLDLANEESREDILFNLEVFKTVRFL
jgi:hypothetical protein